MVVQLTISLCTVAVRLFAITYLDNKNSRKRERMWIYLHTYDIIPSLTVGKQKNGCKASEMVWSYIGELIFNMLVLVGAVKMSDRVFREMMGL